MTSPFLFLAIPLVTFVIGSWLITSTYRVRQRAPRYNGGAEEVHVIVPMVVPAHNSSAAFSKYTKTRS